MAILKLQELHILQEYHCKPSKNVVCVAFVLCNILLIAVYNEFTQRECFLLYTLTHLYCIAQVHQSPCCIFVPFYVISIFLNYRIVNLSSEERFTKL